MSKGLAKVTQIGNQGQVTYSTGPNWDFIYEVSTTKNPNYNVGDRVELPDGREFRYAKSIEAVEQGYGCFFTYTGYTAYTALGTSADKGAKEVTVAAVAHAALTKDELRGGFLVIFADADSKSGQFRGIIGNDAAASGAAFKVYLDGGLSANAVAGTAATEVYRNPYNGLGFASYTSNTYPVAGVPAVNVDAANKYFWVQVKGPIWVAPHAGVGAANGQEGCFWRAHGTIESADDSLGVTVPAIHYTSQYAGHIIAGDQAGNGPLFMLQG